MRVFYDTPVLVAAILEDHEHHDPSFAAFSSANTRSSSCGAHNIAEVYVTLTKYPGKQRLSEQQALLAISAIEHRLKIVALDAVEYVASIRRFANIGITGGTIYDGLIAASALKAKADVLYTWNVSHFLLLGDEVARKVRTP